MQAGVGMSVDKATPSSDGLCVVREIHRGVAIDISDCMNKRMVRYFGCRSAIVCCESTAYRASICPAPKSQEIHSWSSGHQG